MSRAIIILGMHRSGTSCLTGSLEEAGLRLGKVNEFSKCNEKGTRENLSFMELNDKVLAAHRASWDNPPPGPVRWLPEHLEEGRRLIDATAGGPVWGFKDPRTLFTLNGWLELLPDAHFIATFRNPYAVAQSLQKRNGFPIDRGLALWRGYNEQLLSVCAEQDIFLISFDWSPLRYERGLEAVCRKFELTKPNEGFEFFETNLRRNESPPYGTMPPALRMIHRRLGAAARRSMRECADYALEIQHTTLKFGLEGNALPEGFHSPQQGIPGLTELGAETRKKKGRISADNKLRRDKIRNIEAAIAAGGARADQIDQLGDLYANGVAWREADSAYRQALAKRRALLGFRLSRDAAEASQGTGRLQLNSFCKMVARQAVQHWSLDLSRRIRSGEILSKNVNNNRAWPMGEVLPKRRSADIIPRTSIATPKKLSIMAPVYNVVREDWLCEMLDSVIQQDPGHRQREIVIIDDASTNGAAKLVADRYSKHVRYLRNEKNLGLVGNHNRCLIEASGEYVHIMHQDDRIQPAFYESLLPVLDGRPDLVAGLCNPAYIDQSGKQHWRTAKSQSRGILDPWQVRLSLDLRIQFPAIVVRRDAFATVGGFSPSLKFSFDWDTWNRIAATGPIWFEPRDLAQYRVHQGSATNKFGLLERVLDVMQTIAHMARLVSVKDCKGIAELAMYKVFFRYWSLLASDTSAELNDEQEALIDFLLSGWTTKNEAGMLKSFFESARLKEHSL